MCLLICSIRSRSLLIILTRKHSFHCFGHMRRELFLSISSQSLADPSLTLTTGALWIRGHEIARNVSITKGLLSKFLESVSHWEFDAGKDHFIQNTSSRQYRRQQFVHNVTSMRSRVTPLLITVRLPACLDSLRMKRVWSRSAGMLVDDCYRICLRPWRPNSGVKEKVRKNKLLQVTVCKNKVRKV